MNHLLLVYPHLFRVLNEEPVKISEDDDDTDDTEPDKHYRGAAGEDDPYDLFD